MLENKIILGGIIKIVTFVIVEVPVTEGVEKFNELFFAIVAKYIFINYLCTSIIEYT